MAFHESQPVSAAQLSSVQRRDCAQLTLAQGPHIIGSLPKGTSHLGSAGFGDRQSKNAIGRKAGISGAQLASPEAPGGASPLGLGCFLGRGHGLEQGAPLLSRLAVRFEELRHCPGLWEGSSGLRPRGAGQEVSSQGGGGGGGGGTWPSLWTQCPGLLHGLAG